MIQGRQCGRASRWGRLFGWIACLVLAGSVRAGSAYAQAVPNLLDLQGNLRTEDGIPLNKAVWMKVSLYDAEYGGNTLYSEDMPLVPVVGGRFAVQLGKDVSLPPSLFSSPSGVWVGISVDGDVELPAQRLVSVPYAMQSQLAQNATVAATAQGLTCTGCVASGQLTDGAVGTSQIAPGAITADHIGAPCGNWQVLKRSPGGWACAADENTEYTAGPGLQLAGTSLGLDADHASGAAWDVRFYTRSEVDQMIASAIVTAQSGAIPSGAILMFNRSCPTGWTRLTALDDRVPRGAAAYGTTGGSDVHSHDAGTLATNNHGHTFSDTVSSSTGTAGSHSHTVNSHSHTESTHVHGYGSLYAAIGTVGNNYLGWASSTTMFMADKRAGTTNQEATNEGIYGSKIFGSTASASGGNTGGAAPGTDSQGNHIHTLADYTCSGTTSSAGGGSLSGTTSSASNVPGYVSVVFCVKN